MSTNNKTTTFSMITGGGSGIGLATALLLGEHGCNLIIVGRNEKKLKNAASLIKKRNPSINVITIARDVGVENDVKNLFQKLYNDKIKIKHLVLCAGSSQSRSFAENSTQGFQDDINNNLTSTYYCLFYSLPILVENSSVVTISSIRARTGTHTGLGYAAAKAGVISLTKSAAIQLAHRKIRVNSIVPGAVYPTDMTKQWKQEKIKAISNSIPLERIGKPEDIAKSIWFFLSESSSYITGQTLDVNGGDWMD